MNPAIISLAAATVLLGFAGSDTAKKDPPKMKPPAAAKAADSTAKAMAPAASATLLTLVTDSPTVTVSIAGKDHASLAFASETQLPKLDVGKLPLTVRAGEKQVLQHDIALAANHHYVVVVYGPAADPKLDLVPAPMVEKGQGELLVFNATTSGPAVDVWVDGKLAANGKALGLGKSVSTNVVPGKHKIELREGEKVVVAKDVSVADTNCECVFLGGVPNGKPALGLTEVSCR